MSSLHRIRRRLKGYRFQVAVRALAIAASAGGAVAAGLIGGTLAWMAVAALSLVAIRLIYGIVRYTERPLREIVRLVEGIRYDDFTVHIGRAHGGALLAELAGGFEELGDTLRRLRSEREEQARFLDMVVRHVPVALLAIDADGAVKVFNPAARRLLGVARLRHVSQLGRISPLLEDALQRTGAGEGSLVHIQREGRRLALAVHATRFRLGGEGVTLVSLQDIGRELEEKELEAWQQLTRVLTHEIVNSVAPIASLAATAREQAAGVAAAEDGAFAGVGEALETIERRSHGLVRFVDAYRSLARLPQPRLELVPVSDLFAGSRMLLAQVLEAQGVAVETAIHPPDMVVQVDAELIEQVILNLILNAAEALDERPDGRIRLHAHLDGAGRPVLEVIDNGPGIAPEVQERIFVPFFSTKSSGSGIGLSLSRQIVRLHGGSLTVDSEPAGGARFTMRL